MVLKIFLKLLDLYIGKSIKIKNRITNEDMKCMNYSHYRIPNNRNSQSFIPFELVESANSVPISYCLGSHNITK